MQPFITRFLMGAAFLAALAPAAAHAGPKGFLESLHRHTMLASTSPGNGDLNPYAVVVVPQDMGVLHKDDVLVTNFNNISNLQGTGSTIVVYSPATGNVTQFASLPPHLAACPGGVGLTTALTVLKSGWVIVGSAPSKDGSTLTKGDGCLAVLDANGHLAATWKGPLINAPWGDIAAIDRGDTATLFISMSGYDLPGPNVLDPATHYPPILHKATVLRLDLRIPQGQAPVLDKQTVVASGFSARADRDNFLFGPTGLALDTDGTLYVTDGYDDEVTAIDNAVTRTDPVTRTDDAVGRVITKGGLLNWPLAMMWVPGHHLLVSNGRNGQVVEIDPVAKKQIYAQWIDSDQAQQPPGNGDLFGLAMTPDGKSFYYVEDDMNTLNLSRP
ncbi:conserved hypothetical protein [Gluconacetobacter diazotrophicus PA1 5]|nr:hypothetical protein [Gluconacetobacter diazotrophicus]ACI52273.1 conserved hypothetical protein [Gluconacetobacter diazotrophicus PA1 5]MBB2156826.1 hypothetical protein [Gluconacetobacter diazotrophicus]TWB04832.1 hypothetical protein FBZ86_11954 [Gluconacetobacter diazotrophicus]